MEYPKKLMTVNEMSQHLGVGKTMLYQAAHHRLSHNYIIRSPGGHKFWFDTEKFEKNRHIVWR